jgi:hypothetical protein
MILFEEYKDCCDSNININSPLEIFHLLIPQKILQKKFVVTTIYQVTEGSAKSILSLSQNEKITFTIDFNLIEKYHPLGILVAG